MLSSGRPHETATTEDGVELERSYLRRDKIILLFNFAFHLGLTFDNAIQHMQNDPESYPFFLTVDNQFAQTLLAFALLVESLRRNQTHTKLSEAYQIPALITFTGAAAVPILYWKIIGGEFNFENVFTDVEKFREAAMHGGNALVTATAALLTGRGFMPKLYTQMECSVSNLANFALDTARAATPPLAATLWVGYYAFGQEYLGIPPLYKEMDLSDPQTMLKFSGLGVGLYAGVEVVGYTANFIARCLKHLCSRSNAANEHMLLDEPAAASSRASRCPTLSLPSCPTLPSLSASWCCKWARRNNPAVTQPLVPDQESQVHTSPSSKRTT